MRLRVIVAIVLFLGVGCAKGPQTVSATGAMTALLNQGLARTTAQNRALADAQALATLDGIGFTLSKSALGHQLDLEQPESASSIVRSQFSAVPNGWLATVWVERSNEVAERMGQLQTVTVEAHATAEHLPAAMHAAKRQALEGLLERSLGELPDGITTGSITLTDMRYVWPDSIEGDEVEVGVSLTGHVRAGETTPLAELDAERIATRIVTEKTQDGLWSEALASVEGFLGTYPRNRRFGVLRVGLQLRLDDVETAQVTVKEAFARCGWDEAQETLARIEPFVGVETTDEIQAMAVEAGVIAPPSVGRGPPPSTAVVEEPSAASDDAKSSPRKKKKRRRKKRR